MNPQKHPLNALVEVLAPESIVAGHGLGDKHRVVQPKDRYVHSSATFIRNGLTK